MDPSICGTHGAEPCGARTPEELETLLEDTLVLRDGEALAALFAPGAVLVAGETDVARGGAAIARLALATWSGAQSYVADPRVVLQHGGIALVVSALALNVVSRGRDGTWRYTVVYGSNDDTIDRGRA